MKPGIRVRIITFHPKDVRARTSSKAGERLVGKVVTTLEGFKKYKDHPQKGWYWGETTDPDYKKEKRFHFAVWIEKEKE